MAKFPDGTVIQRSQGIVLKCAFCGREVKAIGSRKGAHQVQFEPPTLEIEKKQQDKFGVVYELETGLRCSRCKKNGRVVTSYYQHMIVPGRVGIKGKVEIDPVEKLLSFRRGTTRVINHPGKTYKISRLKGRYIIVCNAHILVEGSRNKAKKFVQEHGLANKNH